MELPHQQTRGQRHPSIDARLPVNPHPAPEKISHGMRCRHPGQQQPPGDLIPNHRQKDHQQTRQLNPLVRRRLPAPRANRTLWKYPQPAMLAIHGNLTFSPDGGYRPSSKKPTPREKPRLLVRRAGPTKRAAIAPKSCSDSLRILSPRTVVLPTKNEGRHKACPRQVGWFCRLELQQQRELHLPR
jgi:hypothetical protein